LISGFGLWSAGGGNAGAETYRNGAGV
jgi:hypothetical protein